MLLLSDVNVLLLVDVVPEQRRLPLCMLAGHPNVGVSVSLLRDSRNTLKFRESRSFKLLSTRDPFGVPLLTPYGGG